jgi:hypothetical protein
MMKMDIIDYSQLYIESHYMEFRIPPKNNEVNQIFQKKKFHKFLFD